MTERMTIEDVLADYGVGPFGHLTMKCGTTLVRNEGGEVLLLVLNEDNTVSSFVVPEVIAARQGSELSQCGKSVVWQMHLENVLPEGHARLDEIVAEMAEAAPPPDMDGVVGLVMIDGQLYMLVLGGSPLYPTDEPDYDWPYGFGPN